MRHSLARRGSLMLLISMILLACVCAMPATATASSESRTFRWEHIRIDIDVQADGSAIITEEQQISFQGPYSFVTRVIPLQRLQGISDVAVGDENGWYSEGIDPAYKPASFSGYVPKGQPGRFTVARSGGEVTITWYFVAMNETRTFRIQYRVAGVVRMHKGSDEIWWAAIGPDRGAEVAEAAATIRLPERVPVDTLSATSYEDESRVRGGATVDDYGATYEYNRIIPEDESWTVRLFFPQGMVAAVPPIPFRRYAAPLFISLTFVAAVTVGFIRSARAGSAGLEPLTIDYTRPPEDIPPGVVGYLLSSFGSGAGAATFLDLAQRGYITVTRVQAGTGWRQQVHYDIEDTGKDRAGLLDYERDFLEAVLQRTPFTATQLQTTFATINQGRGISREVDRRRWFVAPQAVPMRAAPIVLGALSAVAVCVGLTVWAGLVGQDWAIAVTLIAGLAAMTLLIIQPMLAYARRTEAGALARQRWASFVHGLRRPNELIARDPQLALQWLPYAVAGGVAYYWQRALGASAAAAPSWYHSEGGTLPTDLLMADFVRDMFWVGVYSAGGGAHGGVGGASGGGGGTAG